MAEKSRKRQNFNEIIKSSDLLDFPSHFAKKLAYVVAIT